MEWYIILILVFAGLFVLLPVMFAWGILVAGGIYQSSRQERPMKEEIPELVCSLDADCPPGYVCVNGRCMLATPAT